MSLQSETETREAAAKVALAKAAAELAKIANEAPMTKEQAEKITRRST